MANKWMDKFKPETQRRIWISVGVGVVVAMLIIIWTFKKDTFMIKPRSAHKAEVKPLAIDGKTLMEKSTAAQLAAINKALAEEEKRKAGGMKPYSTARSAVAGQPGTIVKPNVIDQLIDKKQKSSEQLQPQPAPNEHRNRAAGSLFKTPLPKQPSSGKTGFTAPTPPGENGTYYPQADAVKKKEFTWGGDIEHKENPDAKQKTEKPDGSKDSHGDKKKEKKIVHLPVGFMSARTLNGLMVPATEDGKGELTPLIIRISAPAQLPNGISAQLSGCFVVAEALGNLATSRAKVRPVSLTCLSKKGEAVIESDIKGFVEDADGFPGLKGIIAAPKFGEIVRLAAAAGFLGGLGDGMALTSASNTISAAGPITSFGTSAQDVGIAALGKGISSGVKKITDVYADLLHQTLPTVEVGNGKKITIVVTKGVDFEIKNYKNLTWY
ncbi:hypothetical protein FO488_00365 [Geobacter sp. FeAm09]|uniref:TrbI/VirB10 family protein n=1 Tax=Geobacter sp. FeAm09 TaxID=2597769 RepID=UPI0011EE2828|nr:TrbI/VirB10 family protein [Geobacter sp. FeAm09]QEM66760.1 hypothetical protein FO488_00365 [Geobacter sp. FeAm09]